MNIVIFIAGAKKHFCTQHVFERNVMKNHLTNTREREYII